jgi:hypothetical protein
MRSRPSQAYLVSGCTPPPRSRSPGDSKRGHPRSYPQPRMLPGHRHEERAGCLSGCLAAQSRLRGPLGSRYPVRLDRLPSSSVGTFGPELDAGTIRAPAGCSPSGAGRRWCRRPAPTSSRGPAATPSPSQGTGGAAAAATATAPGVQLLPRPEPVLHPRLISPLRACASRVNGSAEAVRTPNTRSVPMLMVARRQWNRRALMRRRVGGRSAGPRHKPRLASQRCGGRGSRPRPDPCRRSRSGPGHSAWLRPAPASCRCS